MAVLAKYIQYIHMRRACAKSGKSAGTTHAVYHRGHDFPI